MLSILVPSGSIPPSQLLRILTALSQVVANQTAAVGRKMLLRIAQTCLHFSTGLLLHILFMHSW